MQPLSVTLSLSFDAEGRSRPSRLVDSSTLRRAMAGFSEHVSAPQRLVGPMSSESRPHIGPSLKKQTCGLPMLDLPSLGGVRAPPQHRPSRREATSIGRAASKGS